MANKGDLIEGALNKAWGAWGDIEGGKDDPQTNEDNRRNWVQDHIDDLMPLQDKLNDPDERLEMVLSDRYVGLLINTNALLRGKTFDDLRSEFLSGKEGHGTLPMMHTPATKDKINCLNSGIEVMREWANSSDRPVEEKLDAVAEAYESLIVWTHMFNDGNGRTGRFIGELIRSGLSDTDRLAATVSRSGKRMMRPPYVRTREGILESLENSELFVPNEEYLRANLDKFPNDVDGMGANICHLLKKWEDLHSS